MGRSPQDLLQIVWSLMQNGHALLPSAHPTHFRIQGVLSEPTHYTLGSPHIPFFSEVSTVLAKNKRNAKYSRTSCIGFYFLVSNYPKLLQEIISPQKYITSAQEVNQFVLYQLEMCDCRGSYIKTYKNMWPHYYFLKILSSYYTHCNLSSILPQ
jgi:hypothetical protein